MCASYRPEAEFTALQYAAQKNDIQEVKYLIENGEDFDAGPDPALHLALREKNVDIAIILLEAGADFELTDSYGDRPIHIASALGILEVVKYLCALGCNLEVPTHKGLFPLHLAAKYGHIGVIRCLCAAGCNIEARNFDNIRADVTAIKYGHNDIAELLDRLRVAGQRDHFARQLVPTSKPALRISLRLLGHCGVGKTALAKSLNAGLFSSLFRRSSSLHSNKSRPSSPVSTQIEMENTSRKNSLTFEGAHHHHSTSGIHVQHMDVSHVGDIVVWDFSGQENYFPVYHHFLRPSPCSITAVVFSLDDSPSTQVQQVCFWLNFILARQKADLPTRDYGQILLVATHVDLIRSTKNHYGEWISPDAQKTLESVRKLLPHMVNLMDTVVVMDSNVPASFAFKQLKSILANLKHDCAQHILDNYTGLLESTLPWLHTLKQEYDSFPVILKSEFSELLRSQVNLLASDEHIQQLLAQLQAMGEAFPIEHLVVLSVPWLGTQIIGELLSHHFISHSRSIGVYTAEDFQTSYTECDATGVLELLECLDLCDHCDVEGETEYEFPVYIQTETLKGLWNPHDPRYSHRSSLFGGLRLYTSQGVVCLLKSIFYHIQVHLRRNLMVMYTESDSDLFQWKSGSKFCNMDLEGLITLEDDIQGVQCIEVKVRGPSGSSHCCFHFLGNIMRTIRRAIHKVCPGLLVETHILSTDELRLYSDDPFCYSSQLVTSTIMESESTLDIVLYNPNTNSQETITQLILFDDTELIRNIQWGCALSVRKLPAPIKLRLCGLLDPPEPHGRDWCLLAVKLGVCQKRIASYASHHTSHTMRLLTLSECTIGALITSLHELDRDDAAELVLNSAPIYRVVLEHAQT